MCSKTRSGRNLSPYALDDASIGEPVRVDFDLGAALRAAETPFETEPMSSEDVGYLDDEFKLVRLPAHAVGISRPTSHPRSSQTT